MAHQRIVIGFTLVAALILGARQQADGAELLGIDWNGVLYDIAYPGSGAASNPRPTGIPTLSGLAVSPSGMLYAHDAATNHLYRINRQTGQATEIGFLGLDVTEGDLVFHPQTGVLYGAQTAGQDRLYSIDPNTGHATVIGTIVADGDISALAFDAGGHLWALDAQNKSLYQVDPETAAVELTIPLTLVSPTQQIGGTAGMDFAPGCNSPLDNCLFAVGRDNLVTNGTNPFYVVLTPSPGAPTSLRPIGSTGLINGGLSGLRFVPEPSTLTLCLMSGGAVLFRRRRRGC